MAGAVLLDQVAGRHGSEPAGRAADQDGALGVEGEGLALLSGGREARQERPPLAQGELGLCRAQREGRAERLL